MDRRGAMDDRDGTHEMSGAAGTGPAGNGSPAGSAASAVADNGTCRFPSCDGPGRFQGLCLRHYRRATRPGTTGHEAAARHILPRGAESDACRYPGCTDTMDREGLCNACRRLLKGGNPFQKRRAFEAVRAWRAETSAAPVENIPSVEEVDPSTKNPTAPGAPEPDATPATNATEEVSILKKRTNKGKKCAVPGCGKWAFCRALCNAHYMQLITNGPRAEQARQYAAPPRVRPAGGKPKAAAAVGDEPSRAAPDAIAGPYMEADELARLAELLAVPVLEHPSGAKLIYVDDRVIVLTAEGDLLAGKLAPVAPRPGARGAVNV